MALTLFKQFAHEMSITAVFEPPVRNGGSRHTGLVAPPHRNIQVSLSWIIGTIAVD
jgi:hypothetical protein